MYGEVVGWRGWLNAPRGITQLATIVLVDDDPIILSIFKETLESLNHVVISASTCNEVEALFSDTKHSVDLMLTDYHLPDGVGLSNIECAKRQDKCTKIILMSSDARAREQAEAGVCFLQKPFSMRILIQAVQTLLSPVRA